MLFNVAKHIKTNSLTLALRVRPQDLSLDVLELNVFSFADVVDYALNNVRDIVEVVMSKEDAELKFKLCKFDRINKFNIQCNGKNFMLDDLNLDIFKLTVEPVISDEQKPLLEALVD